METQQQFELCHQVLGEVMWGNTGVEGEEEVDSRGRKRSGWKKIFGGRRRAGN